MGYWTRANSEGVIVATRGSPMRLAMDVHQIIHAPVGRHSEKPAEVRKRIERLLAGTLQTQAAGDAVPGWSQQVDRFYDNLKIKLANAKDRLDNLKAKIEARAQNADDEVRAHLDQMQKRIEQDRAKVESAQAEMKKWVEAHESETAAKIAEWKTKHEISALQNRAERADRYAVAAADAASAAIDEAEWAALNAWLAHQDVKSAQAKKAADVR
jgi:exonuclease VII large subunit